MMTGFFLRAIGPVMMLSVVAGCDGKLPRFGRKPPPAPVIAICDPAKADCPVVLTPDDATIRPRYRAGTPAARPGGFVAGTTPEALDASSEDERQAALATGNTGGERQLGRTIASLGAVGEQGFWLKTPMVLAETEGRIVWADNGNAVNVTLTPKPGEATAGSQISLAAMRALGIPLTALPELIVFAK